MAPSSSASRDESSATDGAAAEVGIIGDPFSADFTLLPKDRQTARRERHTDMHGVLPCVDGAAELFKAQPQWHPRCVDPPLRHSNGGTAENKA